MERNKRKGKKKVLDKAIPAYRLKVASKIMIIVFALLIVRIGFIQFVQGAELKELASRQQTLNKIISPKRGAIYDANGKALAMSASVDTITINPSKFIVKESKSKYIYESTAKYKKIELQETFA